jgi:hypothetical protein
MTRMVEQLERLGAELQACANNVVAIETLVLELIGRAGASGDAQVIERAQAVDSLSQQLHRMAKVAEDLAAAGDAGPTPLRETFAALARCSPPAAVAGDLDLF